MWCEQSEQTDYQSVIDVYYKNEPFRFLSITVIWDDMGWNWAGLGEDVMRQNGIGWNGIE